MNFKNYFFIALLFFSVVVYSQDSRINKGFVIVINNNVVSTLSRVHLTLYKTEKKEKIVEFGYIPGDLYLLNLKEMDSIASSKIDSLVLNFDYYEYRKKKQYVNNYKIPLNKEWLKYSFIVLRINDVTQKSEFSTLHGDYYNYSFEFPGYSIIGTKQKK